jgi:O-antigen/teichoic acid export membrane protein
MRLDYVPVVQRMRRGLASQAFGQVVHLFIRLAEVPLFLTFWGAERYGEWLVIAAIPASLAIADIGFTSTTQREMTMRIGAADRQGAIAAFQSTWVLLVILSVVLLATAGVATHFLPVGTWFNLKSMQGGMLPFVVLLLMAHVLVTFQCGLIYGGYSCEGRYGRGIFLSTIMYLLDFAGLALAVALGGGPVEAAAGFLAGRVAGLLLFLYDLPKVAPWLRFGWDSASRQMLWRLVRPSVSSMLFPLGDALNTQGMRLVVGMILGPTAVAVFVSIRTLCRSAMRPAIVMIHLIEPEIARAYGAGRRDLVRLLLTTSSQITLWAVMPICVALWFFGEPLLDLWTRGQIRLDAPLYISLLLASAANGIWFTALMVPYATNRHERIALMLLAVSAGQLLVAIALMPDFNLAGSGVAVLVAELTMALVVLPTAFRLSGATFWNWLAAIVHPPIAVLETLRGKR